MYGREDDRTVETREVPILPNGTIVRCVGSKIISDEFVVMMGPFSDIVFLLTICSSSISVHVPNPTRNAITS